MCDCEGTTVGVFPPFGKGAEKSEADFSNSEMCLATLGRPESSVWSHWEPYSLSNTKTAGHLGTVSGHGVRKVGC